MFNSAKRAVADAASGTLALVLRAGGPNAYRDVVNALWERQPVYSADDIELHLPQVRDPDPAERPLVERIFEAFRCAKRDEPQDRRHAAQGGWKKVMESAYGPLTQALENRDVEQFHRFLANFAASRTQTGIDESARFQKVSDSKRKRLHFEQQVIGQLMHWWKTYESDGRDISALVAPQFGNQSGFRVEGHLITPNAVFSDFYSRLLARLVSNSQPTVAELGAGYGRLAYFLHNQLTDLTYLDFDLPEMLCCASYYLMLAFPEKRFLLHGEADLTAQSLAQHDVLLLPAFVLTRLPDQLVDLFINENSLGVMPASTAGHFVHEICRTSRSIWHRNHEVRRNPFEDGNASLLNREYPIDGEQFDLLIRYCDVERLIGNSLATSKNDMYWYYYRRKQAQSI